MVQLVAKQMIISEPEAPYMQEDNKEQKLVNNLADFAKIFEAKVCVEGIETSGMRDILRKYGINSFQGYYYSKPIEHEEIIAKYCV